jgi:hypothetical protein
LLELSDRHPGFAGEMKNNQRHNPDGHERGRRKKQRTKPVVFHKVNLIKHKTIVI